MIHVQDVTRDYGDFRAVDSVSFTIGPGEIVGFLGPNGAGKSTLLKMLCTYLPPSFGELKIAGHDVVKDSLAVRSLIGPEGLAGAELQERLAWVTEAMTLGEVLKNRVKECSKGFSTTHRARLRTDSRSAGHPDRAILFSSHILAEVAEISDRLLVLQKGRLCLDETVTALKKQSAKENVSLEQLVIRALEESIQNQGERAAGASA
nr:probable multidrug ABC transporter ATP-binding protein YbhF [Nerophis lumbriciformis]